MEELIDKQKGLKGFEDSLMNDHEMERRLVNLTAVPSPPTLLMSIENTNLLVKSPTSKSNV